MVLGTSQSQLARLTGIGRIRIHLYEKGDVRLTAAEEQKIRRGLLAEAKRLRGLADHIEANLGEPTPAAFAGTQ